MMMASVAALSLPTRQGSSITTKMITSMQSLGSSLRLVSLLECFHWADTGWIQHADADRWPYNMIYDVGGWIWYHYFRVSTRNQISPTGITAVSYNAVRLDGVMFELKHVEERWSRWTPITHHWMQQPTTKTTNHVDTWRPSNHPMVE